MPVFTPPTAQESSEDTLFGRYRIPVGVSVLWDGTKFVNTPYPWLGELVNLVEGVTWFQGGRTYSVSDATAALLTAGGFTVVHGGGYGAGSYGAQSYGE